MRHFLSKLMRFLKSKKVNLWIRSFTLIELLIAVGVVAILATVVIITLNPAELFKQSRDANRLASLTSLRKALEISETQAGAKGMGTPQILYLSLPDDAAPASDCPTLQPNLPPLPSGWTYQCVDSAHLGRVDGTGWVPVNLTIAGGLSVLPLDPINRIDPQNFLRNYFFTYATDGQGNFELNAKMESAKYGMGGQ